MCLQPEGKNLIMNRISVFKKYRLSRDRYFEDKSLEAKRFFYDLMCKYRNIWFNEA